MVSHALFTILFACTVLILKLCYFLKFWQCLCLVDMGSTISVLTGKTTPIEPAVYEPKIVPVPSTRLMAPAPVYEYSEENPELPPLDPSYVPFQYNFIEYLAPHSIRLVNTRLISNITFSLKIDICIFASYESFLQHYTIY